MRRLVWLLLLLCAVLLLPLLGARVTGWSDPQPSFLPPRGRSVAILDGLDVNVHDTGEGSPLIFVHGLPSSATDWVGLPNKMARKGYRAINYDRIGYGYSSRPEPGQGRYTYASNAGDLLALMDALQLDRATIIGWSYGGGVAQSLALRHPERVSHLVLVASVGPSFADDGGLLDRLTRSRTGPFLLAWVSSVPPLARFVTRTAVSAAFGPNDSVPLGWVDYTQTMLALPDTLRSYIEEMRREHAEVLVPERIDAPTLVLHGTGDLLVPASVAEDLARRLPHSDLVLVPGASHMLPVTHADLVAEHITTHLERIGP